MSDSFPYELMIADDEQRVLFINVEEHQWATKYADWIRRPGWWLLLRKSDARVVLSVRINEGDQPYFTARHVGITGSAGTNEIIAFGIGKKAHEGQDVRLWVMPGGDVCGGDDVDQLGVLLVRARGVRPA